MKKLYFALILFCSQMILAQVGINTTAPNAQLDIRSGNQAAPTNTDGILIPKIDAFPAVNPTASQQGMLIYLTTLVGSNQPGFYYWNNATTAWIPILSGSLPSSTLDDAYDYGGAGAGRTITADAGAVTIAGADGFVSTGTVGSGALATTFNGAKLMWNPRKAAFRVGRVFGTEWDDANLGQYSIAFGYTVRANGHMATAFGGSTVASGDSSTAFGFSTDATGDYATAFGSGSLASGDNSTAFGEDCIASGDYGTAFGNETNAVGNDSFAFGEMTYATGQNSTVGGLSSTSASFGETVLGIGATTYTLTTNGATRFRTANATDRLFVIGNAIDLNDNNDVDAAERSDAMVILKNGNTGFGTSTPQDKLHIVGNIRMVDGNQAVGKILTSDANGTATWAALGVNSGTLDQAYDSGGAGNGRTITADAGAVNITGPDGLVSIRSAAGGVSAPSGSGVRMVWNPKKSAFRAGQVFASEWDDANIGNGSVAFGVSTIASANQSSAFGFGTIASGGVSAAFGTSTTASGGNSVSFGDNNTASGSVAAVFGAYNAATSYGETVLGVGATTYTLTTNGATQFRAANMSDRLFVVGNAIDANNNNVADTSERSDAMVILKSGYSGIGISRPVSRLDVRDSNVITTSDSQFGNLNVMTNAAQGINIGGALSLGGYNDTAATSASVFGSLEGRKTNATSGNKNGYLSFKTNGGAIDGLTERMRITDGGFVGIGTNTPIRKLHVSTGSSGGTPNGNADFVLESSGAVYQHFLAPSTNETGLLFGSNVSSIRGGVLYNNNTDILQFRAGGNTNRMIITSAGDIGIGNTPGGQFELSLDEGRKPGTTLWTVTSDARLKTIEGNFTLGLNEIKQLKPIRYHYKNVGSRIFEPEVLKTEFSGFLAQDVEKVFPNCVTTDADGYLSLNMHEILIASVNALKELDAKNEQLQLENEELKAKLKQHDEQLAAILAELEKRR